jgi:hypothetical protein
MKRFLFIIALVVTALVAACERPADVASRNLSVAADNFEIMRRVVFYNGITDVYILEVTGFCSIGNDNTSDQFTITCKDATGFKKHFLGLSDNVTYFAEQVEAVDVSTYHTRVMWRPQSILPDIDFQGDLNELTTNKN